MEEAGCSWDMMMEQIQWPSILEALETVPDLTVILDHRATRLAGSSKIQFLKSKGYKDTMEKFAAMPKVYMKISMFGISDPTW